MFENLTRPRMIILTPLILLLLLAMACGSSAPQAETVVVEKEVIKEVIVEKEVIKEIPKQVVVENIIIKEVVVAPPATAVPLAIPRGETFAFPVKPAWVKKAKSADFTLKIVTRSNPGQWDLHYCASIFSCLIPAGRQYNQLVEYDPANPTEIVGDLARGWDVSPDGKEYTFRLHDANWSDGQPVTAQDIKFTLDRIVKPGAIRSRTKAISLFYEPDSATVLDPKTIKVPLKFPAATFLMSLATDYVKMYPEHVAATVSQEDANIPFNLLGSGPWTLISYNRGSDFSYEKNADYFKPGRPFFSGLESFIVRDGARRIAALQTGQVHTIDGSSPTWSPQIMAPLVEESNGRLKAHLMLASNVKAFVLNQSKPPFDDPRVRKALFLGLDRQNVVDIVLTDDAFGQFGVVGTFFPPGPWEDPDTIIAAGVPGYRINKAEDIAEAKALLAQAGYPDGFKAELNMADSRANIAVGEVVAEQLRRDLGIDFVLRPVDTATYHTVLQEGGMAATISTTAPLIFDPSDTLNQSFSMDIEKNPDNWAEPRMTELMAAQEKEVDTAKRQAMFKEIAEILQQGDSQWIPISWHEAGYIHDYRLQGFNMAMTIQMIHKDEGLWWNPKAKCPVEGGCK